MSTTLPSVSNQITSITTYSQLQEILKDPSEVFKHAKIKTQS